MVRPALILLVLAAAGCGSEGERKAAPVAPPPPPPPDAGQRAGHAADPRRVAVPDRDDSPPQAVVTLDDRAEAAMPGDGEPAPVRLARPRVAAATIGRDRDSGVARVRISMTERVRCRARDGGRFRRLRTRYLPPPQIERIRAAPGARLPTERSRTHRLTLSREECGRRAALERIHGELWGEAINGLGLEAVTPHIPFSYRPSAPRTGRR